MARPAPHEPHPRRRGPGGDHRALRRPPERSPDLRGGLLAGHPPEAGGGRLGAGPGPDGARLLQGQGLLRRPGGPPALARRGGCGDRRPAGPSPDRQHPLLRLPPHVRRGQDDQDHADAGPGGAAQGPGPPGLRRDPSLRQAPGPHGLRAPHPRDPGLPDPPPASRRPHAHDLCPHGPVRQSLRHPGPHGHRSGPGGLRPAHDRRGPVPGAGLRGAPPGGPGLPRYRGEPHRLGLQAPGPASGLVQARTWRRLPQPRRLGRHLGGPGGAGQPPPGALGTDGRRPADLVPPRSRRLPLRCGLHGARPRLAVPRRPGPPGVPRLHLPPGGPGGRLGGHGGAAHRGGHAVGLLGALPEPHAPGGIGLPGPRHPPVRTTTTGWRRRARSGPSCATGSAPSRASAGASASRGGWSGWPRRRSMSTRPEAWPGGPSPTWSPSWRGSTGC